MSDVSSLRNNLLRGLYEESRKNPQATPTLAELQPYLGDGMAPELVQLVVDELRTSGLITSVGRKARAAKSLRLTANGYYEAERLEGVIKTPALARIRKAIKDHQKLANIIAAVSVFLAIVAIAYPVFKDRHEQQAVAPMLEDLKALNNASRDGEVGTEQMLFLQEVDTFCRDNPTASEYREMSCELSRGERAPTQDEARNFCRRFTQTLQLGGISCEQFR